MKTKKKADSSLNIMKKLKALLIIKEVEEGGGGIDDEFAPLDEERWLMYSGGRGTRKCGKS